MLRFLGFVVLLISITIYATFVARITANGLNPGAALFTNPDGSACQPICLFGIWPGKTSVEDAVSLLASHPLTRDFDVIIKTPFTVRGRQQPDLLVRFSETPGGLVDTVVLSSGFLVNNKESSISGLFAEEVSLGDFVSLYGVPDYVCVTEKGICTALYAHLGLMIDLVPSSGELEHLMVDASVSRLVLFNMKVCPPARSTSRRSLWRGFTSIERYLSSSTSAATSRTDSALSLSVPCLP